MITLVRSCSHKTRKEVLIGENQAIQAVDYDFSVLDIGKGGYSKS